MTKKVITTSRKRRLGRELRRLRENAGKTMKDAAELIGVTVATISNMERGVHRVRKAELADLLELYEAPAQTRETLEAMRRDANKRGWWTKYGPALPEWFRPYVDLETDAVTVRHVELELVPGLLQTQEYARAVHLAARHVTPVDMVDRSVAARLERQQRLTDSPPLEVWAILSEGVIRRVVGSAHVMAEQLRHMLTLNELPNVKVQILPYSAGAHCSMAGSFSILDFREYPSAVSVEYPAGGLTLEEDEDIARYSLMFDDLRALALSPAESARMIAAVAQDLEQQGRDAR
ncbi:helix-turn-helix domain-containing protein [Gandjariella thermophila]|uniref:Transcriptional regulator n=1 Tax=Gandjariella thermophila TaxID=1931992 RepID=A0A4D4JFD0_9PSEU|nr:helix-turn-helix transcriptional regulator [Gandjariella thermophila]GDY33720.1 transcriptional regulator [Gandjariella thermophila]